MGRDMTKPTKWLRPAKSQISLGIRPVWSETSLSAWRKLGSLATHWAHSEDSDQTGWMPRLIWVFAGRTLILLVLSYRGSNWVVYLYLVWFPKDSLFRTCSHEGFKQLHSSFYSMLPFDNSCLELSRIMRKPVYAICEATKAQISLSICAVSDLCLFCLLPR